MPIPITEYWRARGFNLPPFERRNAEHETTLVASLFVSIDVYDWMFGNPEYPRSTTLFAPQGCGKTSHRIQIARRAREHKHPAILVVTLSDFNYVAGRGEAVTIDDYLTLVKEQVYAQINTRLSSLAFEAQCAAVEAARTATDQLQRLGDMAHAANFGCVYVLIDGIDETPYTRADPASMYQLVRPLLDAPNLMATGRLVFKLFAPASLFDYLARENVGRLDRLPSRTLVWRDEQLRELLMRRLQVYSRVSATDAFGAVQSFNDLCDTPHDIDWHLVAACGGNPRKLFQLADDIVRYHCEHVPDGTSPDEPIGGVALRAVLGLDTPPVVPAVVPPAVQPPDHEPEDVPGGLVYDERNGTIYLNGQAHGTLDGMLHRLMLCFWRNRGQVVTDRELEASVYGEGADVPPRTPDALRKLVTRLRDEYQLRAYITRRRGMGYQLYVGDGGEEAGTDNGTGHTVA